MPEISNFQLGIVLLFYSFYFFNKISLLCYRWSFGDGGYEEFEYKPPYPPSLLCLEFPNQVFLSNNVTYIYSQPGTNLSAVHIT